MYGISLRYSQLGNILDISLTNDFYEISVPVTLPSRCGIYPQYPKDTAFLRILHIPAISEGMQVFFSSRANVHRYMGKLL